MSSLFRPFLIAQKRHLVLRLFALALLAHSPRLLADFTPNSLVSDDRAVMVSGGLIHIATPAK